MQKHERSDADIPNDSTNQQQRDGDWIRDFLIAADESANEEGGVNRLCKQHRVPLATFYEWKRKRADIEAHCTREPLPLEGSDTTRQKGTPRTKDAQQSKNRIGRRQAYGRQKILEILHKVREARKKGEPGSVTKVLETEDVTFGDISRWEKKLAALSGHQIQEPAFVRKSPLAGNVFALPPDQAMNALHEQTLSLERLAAQTSFNQLLVAQVKALRTLIEFLRQQGSSTGADHGTVSEAGSPQLMSEQSIGHNVDSHSHATSEGSDDIRHEEKVDEETSETRFIAFAQLVTGQRTTIDRKQLMDGVMTKFHANISNRVRSSPAMKRVKLSTQRFNIEIENALVTATASYDPKEAGDFCIYAAEHIQKIILERARDNFPLVFPKTATPPSSSNPKR